MMNLYHLRAEAGLMRSTSHSNLSCADAVYAPAYLHKRDELQDQGGSGTSIDPQKSLAVDKATEF